MTTLRAALLRAKVPTQSAFAATDVLGVVHDFAAPEYESTVVLACRITNAPLATVSLQRPDGDFAVRVGDDLMVISAEHSFTRFVLADPQPPTVVRSMAHDPRFAANPYVTDGEKVRAFIGVPLRAVTGELLGALEIHDTRVRNWSDDQVEAATTLACLIEKYLELQQVLQVL